MLRLQMSMYKMHIEINEVGNKGLHLHAIIHS